MGLLSRASDENRKDHSTALSEMGNPPPGRIPKALWEDLCQYYSGKPFSGVVFEVPRDRTGPQGLNRLAHISAFLGTVLSLPQNRSLLLFPRSLDGELIVHRLSRSLKTTPLLFFEAETPKEATDRLSGIL